MDKQPPEDSDPYGARVNYGRIEGGNGSSKVVWWLMGGLLTLYVAMSGAYIVWTGTSIVQLKTDVAVIKCQVSKQCQESQK